MFKQALAGIVERTEGAAGALIMGVDGIAVERVFLPEASEGNMDVAAAEMNSLVRAALRAAGNTGLGELQELVVAFDDLMLLARLFTNEYFVVLALRPGGNLGRGRFELRKAQLDLAREFAV